MEQYPLWSSSDSRIFVLLLLSHHLQIVRSYDGRDGRIYPQGIPQCPKKRRLSIKLYLEGREPAICSFTNVPPAGIMSGAKPPCAQDLRTNEECLSLTS